MDATSISIKELLEAGVHFGHQTRRWNPKMKEYIFGERNGIYIIDLQKTLQLFEKAVSFITQLTTQGRTVLFVGTKRQAQEAIVEEAQRCNMYYVDNRWLGGLLTNFSTVRISIKRYKELESMKEKDFYQRLSNKEVARLERERRKLEKNLKGIRDMDRLPDAVFIVDSNRESIAVSEASKLGIPIVAIVDTNCDPGVIDYIIPGNDDALRAIRLYTATIADAVLAGQSIYQTRMETKMKDAAEAEAKLAAIEETKKREAAQIQAQPEEIVVEEAKAKAARPTPPLGEQKEKSLKVPQLDIAQTDAQKVPAPQEKSVEATPLRPVKAKQLVKARKHPTPVKTAAMPTSKVAVKVKVSAKTKAKPAQTQLLAQQATKSGAKKTTPKKKSVVGKKTAPGKTSTASQKEKKSAAGTTVPKSPTDPPSVTRKVASPRIKKGKPDAKTES